MVSDCLDTFLSRSFRFAWFWNPPAPTPRWWMGLPITLHTATPSCHINYIPLRAWCFWTWPKSTGILSRSYQVAEYQPDRQNLKHKPDSKRKIISTHQWQLPLLKLQNITTDCVGALRVSSPFRRWIDWDRLYRWFCWWFRCFNAALSNKHIHRINIGYNYMG